MEFIKEKQKYEIGHKGQGGIVFHIDGNKVYEAQFSDLGVMNWYEALKVCKKSDSLGYKDWKLPSKDELDLMYKNLHLKGIGVFQDNFYWSSSEYSSFDAWLQYFDSGYPNPSNKDNLKRVRAIRVFEVRGSENRPVDKDFENWYFWEGNIVNSMEDPYDIAEAAWNAAKEKYFGEDEMEIYKTKEQEVDPYEVEEQEVDPYDLAESMYRASKRIWRDAIKYPPDYEELVLILRYTHFGSDAKLVKTFGWRKKTDKVGDHYATWGKAYGPVSLWQHYPETPVEED